MGPEALGWCCQCTGTLTVQYQKCSECTSTRPWVWDLKRFLEEQGGGAGGAAWYKRGRALNISLATSSNAVRTIVDRIKRLPMM